MLAPPIPDRPCALLLDLDGTLIELAPSPEQIHVSDDLRALLRHLHQQLQGAVACISGRSYENLNQWLGSSGIDLAGSHGAEVGAALLPDLRWQVWANQCKYDVHKQGSDLLIEVKPLGMAIHWRQCPNAEPWIRKWVDNHLSLYPAHHCTEGKCVLELHTARCNKGKAVDQLMCEERYARKLPIYIGDDTTDVAAFAAVKAYGGWAVAVGRKIAHEADFVLPHSQACQQWLRQLSVSLEHRMHRLL